MTEKRDRMIYYWCAFLMQFIAVGICIGLHRLFINIGPQIASPELINGELTDPTVGRLIYVFVAGILFIVLAVLAMREAKNGRDMKAFILGVFGGIFLWQSIGEDVWHFSIGGVHFACLESIAVFPLAVLFILMLLYFTRISPLNWGLLCAVFSFAVNWLGHFVLIGIHPFVASAIDITVWNMIVGLSVGTVFIVCGVLSGVRKNRTDRSRMLCSIITYFGAGVLVFAIMN